SHDERPHGLIELPPSPPPPGLQSPGGLLGPLPLPSLQTQHRLDHVGVAHLGGRRPGPEDAQRSAKVTPARRGLAQPECGARRRASSYRSWNSTPPFVVSR